LIKAQQNLTIICRCYQ